jgi:hypothetical protein
MAHFMGEKDLLDSKLASQEGASGNSDACVRDNHSLDQRPAPAILSATKTIVFPETLTPYLREFVLDHPTNRRLACEII